MKVLVTGATGFVGANVTLALAEAGHAVVALHRRPIEDDLRQDLSRLADRVVLVQGDAGDRETVEWLLDQHRPTHVVHAAAITPSPEMEREQPRPIVEANELSTLALLVAAARHGLERFVYLSSAAVYAAAVAPRLDWTDEDAPLDDGDRLYALTKIAGERLCRWATGRLGIDTRALRPTNVYGPYERPTPSRQTMSSVYLAVHLALAGTPLRANGRAVVRDWVHVADVARAVILLLESSRLRHHAYNVTAEAVTMEGLIDAVAAAVPNVSVSWVESATAANVPVFSEHVPAPLTIGRLRAETGFSPRYPLADGIRAYVAWLQHRAGTSDSDWP